MHEVTQDPRRPDGTQPTPPEPGSVHVIVAGAHTRVVLSGEIDVKILAELSDAVEEAEAAGLPVQVDARHITFMDSSGVTMLARLAGRMPGRVAVIEPPEVVRFLLEVTRIGEIVDVLDVDPGTDGDDDFPYGAA